MDMRVEDSLASHKKSFNHVKHKNNKELSREFEKPKSAMKHQKLHGKLSEYVVLTIQVESASFYV